MSDTIKKIFTAETLFDFCFATYCGESGSKETEYDLDWEDFLDEETVDLYDELSNNDQKQFDQSIRKVLKKLGAEFKKLPVDVDSDAALMKFQTKKAELAKKVAELMPEFLK